MFFFDIDHPWVANYTLVPAVFLVIPPESAVVRLCRFKTIEGRISGPLLDRFDMHIEVPRLSYSELRQGSGSQESSEMVRERVIAARERQWARLGPAKTNAEMTSKESKEFGRLSSSREALLQRVFDGQSLSARAHDRILRVARTIADLGDSSDILPEHLAEAIQFRALDKRLI